MAINTVSAVLLFALSQAVVVLGGKAGHLAALAPVCPLSTITACISVAVQPTPTPGNDGCVTITMPDCVGCGCPTCSHTHIYTTTLDVFGGLFGVRPSAYTVKEIYHGMSRAPIYPPLTQGVPYGFTAGLATCTSCGILPLVRTMTYPIGGRPVPLTGLASPQPTRRAEAADQAIPQEPVITHAPASPLMEREESSNVARSPVKANAAMHESVNRGLAMKMLMMPLGFLLW